MRRSALPLVAFVATAIGVLSLVPAGAAAGADSSADALIGALSDQLIVLGVTVAVAVEGALLYVLVRYRNSGAAKPSELNPRFLATWVVAIGLILFFVGFASLQTLAALDQGQPGPADAEGAAAENTVRVDVVAEQWAWKFEYRDADVETRGTLVVPANETVHLRITSEDVIHSFHVPELSLKRDANPAQWNHLTFTATSTGEFRVYCAEYCGQGHSQMLATVRVDNRSEYEDWLDEQGGNGTANGTS